jgi:3D (Asp-Asp-Asp) domain-containing protein
VATDDPYANPVERAHPAIEHHQSRASGKLGQPGRLSATDNHVRFKIGRNHLRTYERSSRHFVLAGRSQVREVTAYNVGDPDQNWGDPCQSANGENICAALDSGSKRCAANFVPFGTILRIAHYGICTVTDRMNKRYTDRVDIAMKKDEKEKALRFGLKRLPVTVISTRDG